MNQTVTDGIEIEDTVENKILHVLSIYPQISPSMLQIGLGIPANEYRPILEILIESGRVARKTVVSPTPSGRHQSYTVICGLEGGVNV